MFHPNILSHLQFCHIERWSFTLEGDTGGVIPVIGCDKQD